MKRQPWTEQQWRDYAIRLRRIADEFAEAAVEIQDTFTVKEYAPIWNLLTRLRRAPLSIENAVCRQIGDNAGMRALHGPESFPDKQ